MLFASKSTTAWHQESLSRRDSASEKSPTFGWRWRMNRRVIGKKVTIMTSQLLHSQPKMEHVFDDVDIITFTDGRMAGEENFIARELDGLTVGLSHRHLFLDFSNVGYINSSELGTIIRLHKNMKAAGGRLTLVNVNPHIGQVLERTRLNRLLEVRTEGPKREVSWLEAIPYPDNG